MVAEQHTVSLSSGEVAYAVAGAGAPLLYLHGDDGVSWNAVLDGLAASHRVYAPIAPGFGARPRHGAVQDVKDLAALYGEFMDTVILRAVAADAGVDASQARSCDVIGQAFGGSVAAWLALLHPDRIGQLVMCAASGIGPAQRVDQSTQALRLHGQQGNAEALRTFAQNHAVAEAYIGSQLRDEELIARLPEIDHLTLILHASADSVVSQAGAQFLRAQLRRSYLIYVWGAADCMASDQARRVLAVTRSFLERSEAFVVNWGDATRTA